MSAVEATRAEERKTPSALRNLSRVCCAGGLKNFAKSGGADAQKTPKSGSSDGLPLGVTPFFGTSGLRGWVTPRGKGLPTEQGVTPGGYPGGSFAVNVL